MRTEMKENEDDMLAKVETTGDGGKEKLVGEKM